ncbi:MAG: PilZ domain-containing protein [Deltaproteobacteria bacterium]|nr:PilZ domain-containing protein [Deltaproteobacteria bacterium]
MGIRIVLVSMEGEARQAYLDALKPFGVEVDTVSSFRELRRLMTDNFYNGVMLDLKTKIKGQKEDEELAYEILEQFPMAQLKYEEKTGSIGALYYVQSGESRTLDKFINEECRTFKARPIRSSVRKEVNFNVIISKTGDFSDDSCERTVTIDVSMGGCFIYSTGNWKASNSVTFLIKELSDSRPALGEVRWVNPWGKAMQIPGIGVKFEDIGENQLKEICKKGHLT